MVTPRARSLLTFLHKNIIEQEIETMGEARRFVRRLDGLTEGERLFLNCALLDPRDLKKFGEIFGERAIRS
jgi:hypothetical protein